MKHQPHPVLLEQPPEKSILKQEPIQAAPSTSSTGLRRLLNRGNTRIGDLQWELGYLLQQQQGKFIEKMVIVLQAQQKRLDSLTDSVLQGSSHAIKTLTHLKRKKRASHHNHSGQWSLGPGASSGRDTGSQSNFISDIGRASRKHHGYTSTPASAPAAVDRYGLSLLYLR